MLGILTDATFKLKEKFPINTLVSVFFVFFLLSIYYHIIKVIKRALFPVPAPRLQINKIHTKSAWVKTFLPKQTAWLHNLVITMVPRRENNGTFVGYSKIITAKFKRKQKKKKEKKKKTPLKIKA